MGVRTWRKAAFAVLCAALLTAPLAAPATAGPEAEHPGTLDTRFSDDGMLTSDYASVRGAPTSEVALAVAVQADGRVLVAGATMRPIVGGGGGHSEAKMLLGRYTPDGRRDAGFGDGGIARAPFPGFSRPQGVALASDGSVVVAGLTYDESQEYIQNGEHQNFAVARFLGGSSVQEGPAAPGPALTGPAPLTSLKRTLTLTYAKQRQAFIGRVTSPAASCARAVKVTVYAAKPGADRVVGTGTTDRKGGYTVRKWLPAGRYYARVSRAELPAAGVCAAAKSASIKL